MLALPVVTGFAGFFPSLLLFVLYWIYMTFTAFLILEVNLWMGPEANMISMAKMTLGRFGEIVSWLAYLFLLYALTTAYLAGGGPIIVDFFQVFTDWEIPKWIGSIPLLVIFGYFVYHGTHSVDYVNRLLMIGLAIAYIALVYFLAPHLNLALLKVVAWKPLLLGISIVATSFGFHIIIPSLVTYLHRDVVQLKKVILMGSFIPLVVYIIWELLTLGIIPITGPNSLSEGYTTGENGANLLAARLGNTWIALLARLFSFFAIVTSFLGVSLSLSDFLADGFKIKRTGLGKALIALLTFVPPLVLTLTDPRAFLSALEYAGAFGVILLLALIPALMVWVGRYRQHHQGPYQAPGGKLALLATLCISLAIIVIEIVNRL
jgi:tyrosine-specific transport protein